MKKIFEPSSSAARTYIERGIYFFLFIVAPIILALSAQVEAPLLDGFHEGEYLVAAAVIRDYYLGNAVFPILVHGAMDYVPALIAAMLAGQDHLIVWTRLLNTMVVAICWVSFMDIGRTLLRNHPQRYVLLGVFVAVFFVMTNAADLDPIHRQQSFIGTRDFFLIVSIWSVVRAVACAQPFAVLGFHTLAGATAALSLYWSYDRGIIASVWLIALSVGFIYERRYKRVAVLLISYAAALLLVSETKILGTAGENLHNIAYWIKSSGDVWYMSLRAKALAIPGALALLTFAMLVMAYAVGWLLKNRQHPAVPQVLGFLAIQAVFLTKLYSLPSFPTSHYFIWPAVILLVTIAPELYWTRALNEQLTNFWRVGHGWSVATRGGRILCFALVALALSFFGNAVSFSAFTVRAAIRAPADMELLDTERYAVEGISTDNVSCVLLWTNEGALSVYLNKRPCTNYLYPVYISQAEEKAVLSELKKSPPGLIVYDSPYWSTAIFKRSMKERLPAIDQFINENYVFRENRYGYIFATPKQK